MILPKISFYILLLSVAFAQISAAPVTSDSEYNRSLSDDVDGIGLREVGNELSPADVF